MTDQEAQQILLEIINRAQEGKSSEFQLITTWADFIFYIKNKRSVKAVIRLLRDAANNTFKEYCQDITSGTSDITKLLAYTELLRIKAFYEKELETLQKMLDEYDEYLGQGHFWYSFLGGERDIWN